MVRRRPLPLALSCFVVYIIENTSWSLMDRIARYRFRLHGV